MSILGVIKGDTRSLDCSSYVLANLPNLSFLHSPPKVESLQFRVQGSPSGFPFSIVPHEP